MIRSRFREFADHLKSKAMELGVAPENHNAETASMTLAQGGHNLTSEGWHLADLRYRGVLLIERVRQTDAIVLLMHARAWLDDNDDTRDKYKLADPEVDLVSLDASGLVDLIITCDFVDPVYITPAEGGRIRWDGEDFEPVEYDLWVAERGEVRGARTDV